MSHTQKTSSIEERVSKMIRGYVRNDELDQAYLCGEPGKLKKEVLALIQEAKAEGYEKGQEDAFRGKIEGFKSISISETYDVPETLRDFFRKEGAQEMKAKMLAALPEKLGSTKDEATSDWFFGYGWDSYEEEAKKLLSALD